MTRHELIALLLRMKGHRKQTELAAELDVTPQFLGDVFANRRDPGKKILSKLGLEKVVTYQHIKGKKK